IWALGVTRLCRGPPRWPPNLARVSRLRTSLPAWSFGGPAATTWMKSGRKRSSMTLRNASKLQQDTGTKADVYIGSGDVPKALSQAAAQTKADLLVTGCYPYGTHLRTNGYAIICAVPIPVLNI